MTQATQQLALVDEIGSQYYADLGGYIMAAYEWGVKGSPLEHFDGPEYWVLPLCDEISNFVAKNGFNGHDPVDPVYVAVASGNGAAKSAFAGMLNNWLMSTRPFAHITITANTGNQLTFKTWPQIDKWTRLSWTADWFEIQSEKMYHKQHERDWFASKHTWNIANTQASAGQHARESSSVYIVDEASHVPESILNEFDGGLTDGEPFFILLGNCTNRSSRLFRAVFGNLKKFYINRSVDTRKCKYTNKKQIEQWIEQRGIDSDWVKAHIKGEAPSADDLQFIDDVRVEAARERRIPDNNTIEPLILGIDFARGGADDNRLTWRRGRDARSIPSMRIPGAKTRDTMLMVTLIGNEIAEKKPDAIFGDAGGLGGPIMDRLRQLYGRQVPIIDVQYGSSSPDERNGNMRAYIWDKLRTWLASGCIEDSEELKIEITGPHSYEAANGKQYLESKEDMAERGLASPDWADSLANTFAAPVIKKQENVVKPKRVIPRPMKTAGRGWMRR